MCYSAMVTQHLKKLGLEFQARIDYALFKDVFRRRAEGDRLKLPRGMEANFKSGSDQVSVEIKNYIKTYNDQAAVLLEEDLFVQKKRLAEAERKPDRKQGSE